MLVKLKLNILVPQSTNNILFSYTLWPNLILNLDKTSLIVTKSLIKVCVGSALFTRGGKVEGKKIDYYIQYLSFFYHQLKIC